MFTEKLVENPRSVVDNLRCNERADSAKDGAGADPDAPDHGGEDLAAVKFKI